VRVPRGIKPVENDILNAEKTVNKEKMASYAEILKDDGKENENTNTNINTKKSVFLIIHINTPHIPDTLYTLYTL
jgi:hypothetical protein